MYNDNNHTDSRENNFNNDNNDYSDNADNNEKYDNTELLKNGHYDFFTIDKINSFLKKKQRYVPIEYAGMGWMLIKKGVIEKIKYPWFFRGTEEFAPGIVDMVSEDVAFCKNIKEAGYKIMLDTKIHVGHIKTVVI